MILGDELMFRFYNSILQDCHVLLFFLAGFSEAADGIQQSEYQHSEIMICQIALHVFLQGDFNLSNKCDY